ncbi:MAG: flavodoxin [Asticcacaulis sp.]
MMLKNLSRRLMLSAPLFLASCSQAAERPTEETKNQRPTSKILVVYFTRSGNTKVIAGTISRLLSADLFEIRAARPYPEDYEATVEQARLETTRGDEPPLAATIADLSAYETIYLGFPVWGGTAPPVIRTFLRQHDLSGKTLYPLITHGGYGTGNSLDVLKSHAPNARHQAPFVMEADQERRTLTQIRTWLGTTER